MCTVASAPAAFRVRVWAVMSRGRGPRGCPPPEGVDVAYPPSAERGSPDVLTTATYLTSTVETPTIPVWTAAASC
jgi:hypothetical protein